MKKLFFILPILLLFPVIAFAFVETPDPVNDINTIITVSGLQLGYYYVFFDSQLNNYCYVRFQDYGSGNIENTLNELNTCGEGEAGTWSILELYNNPDGNNYTTLRYGELFSSEQTFVLLDGELPPVIPDNKQYTYLASIDLATIDIIMGLFVLFIIFFIMTVINKIFIKFIRKILNIDDNF